MSIGKEKFEARLADLKNRMQMLANQRQDLTQKLTECDANIGAVNGAIQDTSWYIDEVEGKHEKPAEVIVPSKTAKTKTKPKAKAKVKKLEKA